MTVLLGQYSLKRGRLIGLGIPIINLRPKRRRPFKQIQTAVRRHIRFPRGRPFVTIYQTIWFYIFEALKLERLIAWRWYSICFSHWVAVVAKNFVKINISQDRTCGKASLTFYGKGSDVFIHVWELVVQLHISFILWLVCEHDLTV